MDSLKDIEAWVEREAMLEPGDSEAGQGTVEGPLVVRLSDVEPEPVHWLWEGYVARGKVNLFAGDPGLGKSWATLDLSARVTVGGETPDRQHIMEQGAVVLLTAEDGLADTVRPRIDVQGGNAHMVHVLDGINGADGHDRLPSLVEDIHHLEQVVTSTEAHLVIVDPLNAYTGRTDSHTDARVRQALTPHWRRWRSAPAPRSSWSCT
jgi:putative DNA primase/helicase